jgi:hypothetical protein
MSWIEEFPKKRKKKGKPPCGPLKGCEDGEEFSYVLSICVEVESMSGFKRYEGKPPSPLTGAILWWSGHVRDVQDHDERGVSYGLSVGHQLICPCK